MKRATGSVYAPLFRVFVVAMLSACLVCSPLWSLKSASATTRESASDDRSLQSGLPQQGQENQPRELLITLRQESSQALEQVFEALGEKHHRLRGAGNVVLLTLKDHLDLNTTLATLQRLDKVIEWVEPNHLVTRASVGQTVSLPRARKTPPSKENRGLPTSTTIIALIDTGVDIHHRALKDAISLNASEKSGPSGSDDDRNGFIDDTRGWNFINDSNDIADDNGHGTQIAGIIAQSATHKSRVPIKILPLKALDSTGEGTIADVVEAIDYAVARHAAVINCSFGTPANSPAMLDAIKRAETAGIVVVAAAGNNGKNLSESPFYPASYRMPNLVSVAATDENNLLTSFSNYSADIAAPGMNIRTLHPGQSHVRLSGTSAAAGVVSAAAGQLKSRRGWVSARTVRDSLLKSAQRSFDLSGKVSSGSINVAGAISLLTRGDLINRTKKNRAPRTLKTALQSSGNLNAMRGAEPQAPNAYQQTGTLPSPSYDDPKPAITANYDSYLTQMTVPSNATGVAGSLPLQSVDMTAGSASVGGVSINLDTGNFNFTAPALSLAGRAGLNLSLGPSYNSKLWMKDSVLNKIVFNADRGFPAPGWRLGFGFIQVKINTFGAYLNSTTGKYSIIYIDPDGTRHDLAFNPATNRYESYDSSYIAFDANQQIMYFPNGTKAQFGSANSYDPNVRDFQQYPTEIKDRNGNFITLPWYRSKPRRPNISTTAWLTARICAWRMSRSPTMQATRRIRMSPTPSLTALCGCRQPRTNTRGQASIGGRSPAT